MNKEEMIDYLIFISKPFYNEDEHETYVEELKNMSEEDLIGEYDYRVLNEF